MKVYSIGRDNDCNIVIDDNTDVISRRHAILNVSSWGKMTIVDQSRNGTYVNGIRITPNAPVPVTRKDNISFAHIARLDWNRVPRVFNPLIYAGIALLAVLLILAIIWVVKTFHGEDVPSPQPEMSIVLTPEQLKHQQDSIRDEALRQAKDEQEKQRLKDSIDAVTAEKVAKAKADSIVKAKQDSIAKIKVIVVKCKYCGKPIDKCPNKGKKHTIDKTKPNEEKRDSLKRF